MGMGVCGNAGVRHVHAFRLLSEASYMRIMGRMGHFSFLVDTLFSYVMFSFRDIETIIKVSHAYLHEIFTRACTALYHSK